MSCHRDGGRLALFTLSLQARDLSARLLTQAALGAGVEQADRLDLITEEFQAERRIGVGGEDIEDSAAAAELARQLDGLGAAKAVVDQPARQFVEIEGVAGTEDAAVARELGA